MDPNCTTEAHKERKMQFAPSVLSVSESYVFVTLSETTLLKYWCLPIETFDDLELYIDTDVVGIEILFREIGGRASAANGAVGVDELAEVVRVVKRLGEHISLMPNGPAKKLKRDASRDCVMVKYLRAPLAAVDPDDDDWMTHTNAIVTKVNQLRQEVATNEMMLEEDDVPNIHLHLSSIGNVMGARDESTDPRPIMKHLKFYGASTNALSENASLVDIRV